MSLDVPRHFMQLFVLDLVLRLKKTTSFARARVMDEFLRIWDGDVVNTGRIVFLAVKNCSRRRRESAWETLQLDWECVEISMVVTIERKMYICIHFSKL